MKISGSTRVCMSVANPNRTTPAPVMHNAAFDALGLDYVYVAFEPDEIGGAVAALRVLKMPGCSISKPYKIEAVALVDSLGETAQRIGAINTIVNRDDELIGYNTDWVGAVEALRRHGDLTDLRVAVVGAGAAAQAVTFGLRHASATPIIFNRSRERGSSLSAEYDTEYGGDIPDVDQRDDIDVLINCTSLGREPAESLPIDLRTMHRLRTVLDVTFTVPSTALLEEATALGLGAIHGTEMLVEQGAVQFRLFTGIDPPLDVMRAALHEHLFS